MPRNSLDGSAFPGLEQEHRSTPHTDRVRGEKKNEMQTEHAGENKPIGEKTEESL